MQDVFIGRQPIYDRGRTLYAYELLFRSSAANKASVADGDRATSQVIANTFSEFGLDEIVGQHRAFINLTRSFILGLYPLPLIKDRVVLEILEDVPIDGDVINAVHRLADDGYTIALDDFIYHRKLQPLVDVANVIKIDVLEAERDKLREHVELLRQYDVALLAEKVESREDYEFCQELGFDYFQGYYLSHPNVIQGKRMPAAREQTLDLLAEVFVDALELQRFERLFKHDPQLMTQLVAFVNSAQFGFDRPMTSVVEIILRLGIDSVRNLAAVVRLAQLELVSSEVLLETFARARMCETLGRHLGRIKSDDYFSLGLVSNLDTVFALPRRVVLSRLPLSPRLRQALEEGAGELGEILSCVLAYESGAWTRMRCPHADADVVREAYLEAVAWAGSALHQLKGGHAASGA
jgi:EAL and modified HD-GYP domain-containing signal transduction protein